MATKGEGGKRGGARGDGSGTRKTRGAADAGGTSKSSGTARSARSTGSARGMRATGGARKAGTPRSAASAGGGNASSAPARAKAGTRFSPLAIGAAAIGAIALAGGAALALLRRGRRREEGHVPTDLMGDTHPGPNDRAIDAFRPDPTAPLSDADREALRPALATPTPAEDQAPARPGGMPS